MEVKRLVNLVYLVGGAVAFTILDAFLDWVWVPFSDGVNYLAIEYLGASGTVVANYAILGSYVTLTTVLALVTAGALTYWLYQPEEYRSFLSEVIIELKKVTWPDWNETRRNTVVVIGFTVILAGFLWISDKVWQALTNLVLTPGA
jgi:preprotein translocase SecE subunit